MNTNSSPSSDRARRALVLGGGGSTGNAWLVGVIAGLFDGGVDVTTPDVTVGTSAGSTAAAQLAGATPPELYAATIAPPPPQYAAAMGARPNRARVAEASAHIERMTALVAASNDAAEFRRAMARAALEADASSDPGASERWRDTVAARLPAAQWPNRTILITAMDAESAEPVVFDRNTGVDLVDAVAASCASGFAYRIGHRRYIDGGYRSNAENADLAAGCERVLVLAPFGGRTFAPLAWGTHLAAQVDELRAAGSRVEVIAPEPDAAHLFGATAMDVSLRPDAARAGFDQGVALAPRIRGFWS